MAEVSGSCSYILLGAITFLAASMIFAINTVLLLTEKNARIRSLEKIIIIALQKPSFYAHTYQHQGDIMPEEQGIYINPQGDAIGVSVGDGNILEGVFTKTTGDVANVASQTPASQQATSPRINALLTQLQRQIENDNELSAQDKANALEQVKALGLLQQDSTKQVMMATSEELVPDL